MKKINTTIIALLFAMTSMFATNTPGLGEDVMTFEVNSGAEHLVSYELNIEDGELSFETANDINFLQVLGEDGTLEYQLPVMSNSINIDLEEFADGEYQVNLLISNDTMVSSTFKK